MGAAGTPPAGSSWASGPGVSCVSKRDASSAPRWSITRNRIEATRWSFGTSTIGNHCAALTTTAQNKRSKRVAPFAAVTLTVYPWIRHTIGVIDMGRKTIRCPICGTWKIDSIDAGPCDECIDGHADTSNDETDTTDPTPSEQGAEAE